MKIGKNLSAISIMLAMFLIWLKSQWDYAIYMQLREILSGANGDISPTIVADSLGSLLIYLLLALLSLALSIVGFKRKNRLHKLAIVTNVLALIYLIIPLGLLLGT